MLNIPSAAVLIVAVVLFGEVDDAYSRSVVKAQLIKHEKHLDTVPGKRTMVKRSGIYSDPTSDFVKPPKKQKSDEPFEEAGLSKRSVPANFVPKAPKEKLSKTGPYSDETSVVKRSLTQQGEVVRKAQKEIDLKLEAYTDNGVMVKRSLRYFDPTSDFVKPPKKQKSDEPFEEAGLSKRSVPAKFVPKAPKENLSKTGPYSDEASVVKRSLNQQGEVVRKAQKESDLKPEAYTDDGVW